ncbi:MAG: PPOX class F420-dependent oxidoreductase, partial [Ilumatobacteraceae bacterium]
KVILQPCDSRGRLKAGTSPVEATAELVTGPQFEGIRSKIRAKYGFMCKLTKFLAGANGFVRRKPIPYGDLGVLITPS